MPSCFIDRVSSETLRPAALLQSANSICVAISLFSCKHKPCYIWHVATETSFRLRTTVASSTKTNSGREKAFVTLQSQQRRKNLASRSLFFIKQRRTVISLQAGIQLTLTETHPGLRALTQSSQITGRLKAAVPLQLAPNNWVNLAV